MIEFTNSEALIFRNKYLILADLHIGIEREYLLKGINIPSQTNIILNKILDIKDKYNVSKLIILGDFKHNIPKISYIELKEVPYILNILSREFSRVIITKGNHDGKLEDFVEKQNIKVVRAFKLGGIVFTHGHARTKLKGKLYLIGHHHFVKRIQTKIGESIYEKIFVLGETDEGENILIFPAFSNLAGSWEIGSFHGPLAKKIRAYEIYSLDGTLLQEVR